MSQTDTWEIGMNSEKGISKQKLYFEISTKYNPSRGEGARVGRTEEYMSRYRETESTVISRN